MTKVKICGLKDVAAVRAACDAGADLVGFVFAESRRQVTTFQARELVQEVPPEIAKVGVFLDPSIEELTDICRQVPLDLLQIHGRIPQAPLPHPVIHGVNVGKMQLDLPVLAATDFLLLDAPMAEYGGGSGVAFDWQRFSADSLPQKQLFIAGGLNLDNIQSAITHFKPYGVDVSSGVETNGHKDSAKIRAFIQQAKNL